MVADAGLTKGSIMKCVVFLGLFGLAATAGNKALASMEPVYWCESQCQGRNDRSESVVVSGSAMNELESEQNSLFQCENMKLIECRVIRTKCCPSK